MASVAVSGRHVQDKKTGLSLRPSSRNAQNLSLRKTSQPKKPERLAISTGTRLGTKREDILEVMAD